MWVDTGSKILRKDKKLAFYFFHSGNVHSLRKVDGCKAELKRVTLLRGPAVRWPSPALRPLCRHNLLFLDLCFSYYLSLCPVTLSGEAPDRRNRMTVKLRTFLEILKWGPLESRASCSTSSHSVHTAKLPVISGLKTFSQFYLSCKFLY